MNKALGAQCAGIKVGFRVSEFHPLSLNDFFGWDGDYGTMMETFNTFVHDDDDKKHVTYISEHTSITGESGSFHDDLIIFMIEAPAELFQQEYDRCVAFLDAIVENPPFNPYTRDNMLQDLEENDIAFDDDIELPKLYQLFNEKVCPHQYLLSFLEKVSNVMAPHYAKQEA